MITHPDGPELALATVVELRQPPIVELRGTVAALTEQIEARETTLAQYRAELEAGEGALNAARLGDDETALARTQVRVNLLQKEIRRISAELAPLRQQHEVSAHQLDEQEGQIAQARAFVEAAHTSGLGGDMTVNEWVRKYHRSLARLAHAGEPVEAQAIVIPAPRWPGQNVPTT